MPSERRAFRALLLVPVIALLAAAASAQVFTCETYGVACRDPIPDPSSDGYAASLASTITVPPGVCSGAEPVGSIGVALRVLHDDVGDLGAIGVTSPGGVWIPLVPSSLNDGEDYVYTAASGTVIPSPPLHRNYFPAGLGTMVYTTAISGAATASGAWTMALRDGTNMSYGAIDDWAIDVACGIPNVTLTTVAPTAIEGYGPPAMVTLSRSPVTTHPVRVFLTVAGSATAGSDYAALSFPIELAGGVASRDLPFAAILDALAEGTETVALSLAPNAGYAGAGPTATTLTLFDQVVPAFTSPSSTTFEMTRPNTFAVTTVAVPTATLTWTGTPPPGVTVTINGDGTATIAGTPPPGSMGIYTLTFTAARAIPPAVSQTVTIAVALPVPALSPWMMILLAAALAALGSMLWKS